MSNRRSEGTIRRMMRSIGRFVITTTALSMRVGAAILLCVCVVLLLLLYVPCLLISERWTSDTTRSKENALFTKLTRRPASKARPSNPTTKRSSKHSRPSKGACTDADGKPVDVDLKI